MRLELDLNFRLDVSISCIFNPCLSISMPYTFDPSIYFAFLILMIPLLFSVRNSPKGTDCNRYSHTSLVFIAQSLASEMHLGGVVVCGVVMLTDAIAICCPRSRSHQRTLSLLAGRGCGHTRTLHTCLHARESELRMYARACAKPSAINDTT